MLVIESDNATATATTTTTDGHVQSPKIRSDRTSTGGRGRGSFSNRRGNRRVPLLWFFSRGRKVWQRLFVFGHPYASPPAQPSSSSSSNIQHPRKRISTSTSNKE
mmetsp:Transcript_54747/g.63197  ORF Transcript_54747/g.63197 Transcript_54747/m.63197 type:complete len:105 (+) Transcript_54747:170-484(+)